MVHLQNMVDPTIEDLHPDLDAPSEEVTPPTPEVVEPAPAIAEAAAPIPHISDALFGVSRDVFIDAIASAVDFLNLADLDPVKTVNALRGTKEEKIRDKIQMANSVIVLLANYGSETDNQELVDSCAAYAEKMKVIIKRLCL